jgi:hypothetical protein
MDVGSDQARRRRRGAARPKGPHRLRSFRRSDRRRGCGSAAPTPRSARAAGNPTPLCEDLPTGQEGADAWAAIGAQVRHETPEDHDAAFAAVSHLPHILAFAYFNAVARQPAGRDYLRSAARDFGLHAHRREQSGGLARHPDGQPRGDPETDRALPPYPDAMEHIKTGSTEALGALIRSASDARRLTDDPDPAHAPLRKAQPAPCSTRFLDLPPLRRRRQGASQVEGISNRALLLAGFASGATKIEGLLHPTTPR